MLNLPRWLWHTCWGSPWRTQGSRPQVENRVRKLQPAIAGLYHRRVSATITNTQLTTAALALRQEKVAKSCPSVLFDRISPKTGVRCSRKIAAAHMPVCLHGPNMRPDSSAQRATMIPQGWLEAWVLLRSFLPAQELLGSEPVSPQAHRMR